MQNNPEPSSLCVCGEGGRGGGFKETMAPAIQIVSQFDMMLCLCIQPRHICDIRHQDVYFPKYCIDLGGTPTLPLTAINALQCCQSLG